MNETIIRSKEIKIIQLSEIKLNPRNRNRHSKEQISRLSDIIKYQGFRQPLIVSNRSGICVAGEGRYLAAKNLGMKQVPVIFQDFESEEQEIAAGVSDNAIAAWSELDLEGINLDIGELGPEFDIDLLGIKGFEIDVADKEGLTDPDEIPETPKESPVCRGELFRLGSHRLLCGDSTSITDVERLMNGEKAEICFTSPPYSDQRDYRGEIDLSIDKIKQFIRTCFSKCSFLVVNLGYSRKDGEVDQYWNDYIQEAKDCKLKLLSWNVWNKKECGSIGNQTAMFGISHEWIFVFGNAPKVLNKTVENKYGGDFSNHNSTRQKDGTVKKGKDRTIGSHSQLKTIYECSAQKARDGIDHPARFPVELPVGYIEAMTNENEIVYEPFSGSGTTLIACEKTNRRCFGMEIDPHYCSVILDRWAAFTGKDPVRLNDDGTETPWSEIKATLKSSILA